MKLPHHAVNSRETTVRIKPIALLAAVGLAIGAFAPAALAAPKSFTAAQVAKHASAASCWTIVGSSVYDMTRYVARHPGGPTVIKALCGRDGSAMFSGQHAGDRAAARVLASYRIGALRTTTAAGSATAVPAPTASTGSSASSSAAITAATVALHNSAADCWTTISGRVYDVTAYIARHPGGSARILSLCGIDGSAAFAGQHAGDSTAMAALAPFAVGTDGTAPAGSSPAAKAPSTGTHVDDDSDDDGDDDRHGHGHDDE
ncbi:MAG: hypothetical protein F2793_02505 [Actinobacteria bacterium]|uniref:Unannotated protein n=1 Tax=freshwater metagenome TaxID=449393 RepID=A0A6J7D8U5_9ZZZZ|nr:hypothetical protein [Actinomycetota bacterium]